MISHALTIVINELKKHLEDVYAIPVSADDVQAGNMAEGIAATASTAGVARDKLIFSVVNIKEEKALKNLPNYVRNDITLRATYENPPVYLNFSVLITATHSNYMNAMLMLSRCIRFFQSRSVFTHNDVHPSSITIGSPANILDKLETFRIVYDLYSPSMEEVNHMWGTLGGKQFPFVMYTMRMLDLKFRAVYNESALITEVVNEFSHKKPL